MNIEIRAFNNAPKIGSDGKTLTGVAIPYNSLSHDLGGFREKFAPGSVSKSVQEGMIEAWFLHNRYMPMGNQAAGTLRLIDGPNSLDYEITLPDTSYVNDMRALFAASPKNIGGTSFGFAPNKGGQKWERDNGTSIRTITDAFLEHISPVVTPAYPATTASLRSIKQIAEDKPLEVGGIDIEKLDGIFIAVDRGLALTADEEEYIRVAIRQLDGFIARPQIKAAAEKASRILLW